MQYKGLILSILFVISLYQVGGTLCISDEKYHDTFKGYTKPDINDWTILNMESSGITSEEIQLALDSIYAYHMINYTLRDIPRNSDEIIWYYYDSKFGKKCVFFGKDNYTLVVFNKNDYQIGLDEVFDKYMGGGYEKKGFIYVREKDSHYDIALRMIHEMAHGEMRDADGMFTNQKTNFTKWMNSVKYPFIDNYNDGGILKNYKSKDVRQVYLDYHLWLYTQ
jgi:hypothetical protein